MSEALGAITAGDLKALKERHRRDALAARDLTAAVDRAHARERLAERVADLPIAPGTTVAGYIAIRSEIDPLPLMQALRGRGHALGLPVILADRETMVFRGWDGIEPLQQSGFGLSVPPPTARQVTPAALLIPLAAFDRRGYRIGYGKGHYDKALARLEQAGPVVKIGIAFANQEIAEVPAEPHDRRLDYMLTETAFFACKET